MTESNLLELAKGFDPRAIATLINHSLQPKGIIAKAALKGDCLRVILESDKLPDQQDVVEFIYKQITTLRVESIKTVKIFAWQTNNTSMAWSQQFDFGVQAHLTIPQDIEPVKSTKQIGLTNKQYENLINKTVNLKNNSQLNFDQLAELSQF